MQFQDFEAWVWTELLAFDNTQEDCGTAAYLKELGFVPQGICLLVSSPDFVLHHPGRLTGRTLPADVCARDGHAGNERRKRQNWTDLQLAKLVASLKAAGSAVYCSTFCVFQENHFTQEWMGEHPEVRLCWANYWRGQEANPLAQLADGTYFEDIWIPQLTAVCRDYGFSGWHGPDGWGPWCSGYIGCLDFSDSMMPQFLAKHSDWELPDCFKPIPRIVTMHEVFAAQERGEANTPDAGLAQLQQRANWVCQYHLREWRDFLSERWAQFWRKVIKALHEIGCKGVINSAWTKGCFDALNEYGIDYRKMAAAGIDAMIVETVALGMSMSRPEITYMHDGFALALAEIKAALPDMKLIMLHGIKDVVEYWDNLRQAPSAYERELYKLSSMFIRDEAGLRRASSGLLGCLADGITREEWSYMSDRWQTAFAGNPVEAGISALYLPETAYGEADADYFKDGFMPALDEAVTLMERGVPLQTWVDWKRASSASLLIVPGAHLAEQGAIQQLLSEHASPVVLIGRAEPLNCYTGELFTDGTLSLLIANTGSVSMQDFISPVPSQSAPGTEEISFYQRRYRKEVAPELWDAAAARIVELNRMHPYVAESNLPCSILYRKYSDAEYEVAVEARAVWGRATATVAMPAAIESCRVLSPFPPRVLSCKANQFRIPVPPRGVTVVRVKLIV